MSAAPDNNPFHVHLNDCRQCWETTFTLSDTGALFLQLSAATASDGETSTLRRGALNLARFAVGGSDDCFLDAAHALAAEVNARGRAIMNATKQAEVSRLREGSQP